MTSHNIGAIWMKWRFAFRILCEKKVALELLVNFTEWWLYRHYSMEWSVGPSIIFMLSC